MLLFATNHNDHAGAGGNMDLNANDDGSLKKTISNAK